MPTGSRLAYRLAGATTATERAAVAYLFSVSLPDRYLWMMLESRVW